MPWRITKQNLNNTFEFQCSTQILSHSLPTDSKSPIFCGYHKTLNGLFRPFRSFSTPSHASLDVNFHIVHIFGPFFVHLIPNLVPERFHGFFVLPLLATTHYIIKLDLKSTLPTKDIPSSSHKLQGLSFSWFSALSDRFRRFIPPQLMRFLKNLWRHFPNFQTWYHCFASPARFSYKRCAVFQVVGGSFPARVPKSSAEMSRVFVHHIVKVEGVGQQEE